jgi:hypothetical protein
VPAETPPDWRRSEVCDNRHEKSKSVPRFVISAAAISVLVIPPLAHRPFATILRRKSPAERAFPSGRRDSNSGPLVPTHKMQPDAARCF